MRRAGLMRVLGETSDGRKWRGVQAQYRRYLYGEGEEIIVERRDEAAAALLGSRAVGAGNRNKRQRGMSEQAVAKVERKGCELGLTQLLRVRVRYFTQSAAFGSREFIEGVFEKNREKMQVKRMRGARQPKEGALRKEAWSGLLDLRGSLRFGLTIHEQGLMRFEGGCF